MDILVSPAKLKGSVRVPASKSMLIRMLFCAALADGCSTLENTNLSDDITAAVDCCRGLGAEVKLVGSCINVTGISPCRDVLRDKCSAAIFDCRQSATVLRFLIPVAMAVLGGGRFTGAPGLMQRPMDEFLKLFGNSLFYASEERSVLCADGTLATGEYTLKGNVSSQFISGLMIALPLVGGGSIHLMNDPVSRPYIELTAYVMKCFGVSVILREKDIDIPAQSYIPRTVSCETDASQQAFWLAANSLGAQITLAGPLPFHQGDAEARNLFPLADGNLLINANAIPDLVPPIALAAAMHKDMVTITGCSRLRYKESDRVTAIANLLTRLGVTVKAESDTLYIIGTGQLRGNVVLDCFRDHRIAMTAILLASFCRSPVMVRGVECIAKSYPDFLSDFIHVGGLFRIL